MIESPEPRRWEHLQEALSVVASESEEDLLIEQLPEPAPQDVARCAVVGPASVDVADDVLASAKARDWLRREWSQTCPNLTLLATSTSTDPDRHDVAVMTRRMLEECHLRQCSRCVKVLVQLDADDRLRNILLDVTAHQWRVLDPQGRHQEAEAESQAFAQHSPWAVQAHQDHVQVVGPLQEDGQAVIVVDTSAERSLTLVAPVPSPSGVTATVHSNSPDLIEVHHHPQLVTENVPESSSVDEEFHWLVFETVIMRPVRGDTPVAMRVGAASFEAANPRERLTTLDETTGVRITVEKRPLRRKWLVTLDGLTPGRYYRLVLAWAGGVEASAEFAADTRATILRVPGTTTLGEPVRARVEVLS